MRHADMRHRVKADDLFLGRHRIDDNPVHAGGKGLVGAGTAIIEHIEHLRCSLVRVFRLHDTVPTLKKIGPCRLFRCLEHPVDLGVIVTLVATDSLILEYKKEAPCERFPAANVLNQFDVILAKLLALRIILSLQFLTNHSHMLVGIGTPCDGFELQAHRGYLEPAREAGNDVELLLIGAKRKVYRLDLQYFDVPPSVVSMIPFFRSLIGR
jgi:hypothetical protein